MSKHVAVLMGGWSAEREVSLVSGRAVAEALEAEGGYRVTPVDVGRDLATRLEELRPDVAFNALHGRGGEDGCVQGLLEILRIPYTHSGVLASALAMDKPMAKRLFAAAGIRCPEGVVAHREEVLADHVLPPPYVVKPLNEGSSVGVRIVADAAGRPFGNERWLFGDRVLVERFVPGRELTVAVMGARALGVTEIRPLTRFYDYEAKYAPGMSEHLLPAPLPPAVYEEATELAVRAHEALGCRGVSRADFRFDDEGGGGLYLLEVNTQPGMTPTSLVPEQAAHAGISFGELVRRLVEEARCDG
jgi:D-alanine-D-alanine ligase